MQHIAILTEKFDGQEDYLGCLQRQKFGFPRAIGQGKEVGTFD